MIASKGDPQMYKSRGKSTGWAAFGQQERRKGIGNGRVSNEPFPSLSTTTTLFENPEKAMGNKHLPVKPFSSVVGSPVNFFATAQDTKKNKQSEAANSSGHDIVFRRLKGQYGWADDNLIEDIMVAVDDDFNTASTFLKAMNSDNIVRNQENEISVRSVQAVTEPLKVCSSLEACIDNGNKDGKNDFIVEADKLSENLMAINTMLGQLTSVPVEPEWEDDDLYLSCRKDAIRRMRAAARHSKAAANSFLRGDHYSAQQFSLKAQEEWESANTLNGKAATEILNLQNKNNGIWRLDLHGLHASEAVQALQERLHIIENQLYFKGSSSSGLPNGSRSGNKIEKYDKQVLFRPDLKWLEVITGIGKHSRGGAALPTAVRTFLVDSGYRIDEARPGVIMVRPKLRSS